MRFLASVMAAAVAAGTVLGWGATNGAQAQDYQTVEVSVEPIGSWAIVGGTVVPYKEVTLSAQIPGEVKFIAGAEGDDFDKGAKLVSIDDEAIQAKRRAALADIYNAEAALRGGPLDAEAIGQRCCDRSRCSTQTAQTSTA